MAVRRRTGIRWDRLGRVALLGTLLMIVFAYASPARQWIKQSGTAGHQKQVLSELTKENRGLKHRLRALRDPGALEREARRLGMVKAGERAYIVTGIK
jgi:cell division protein FtsB